MSSVPSREGRKKEIRKWIVFISEISGLRVVLKWRSCETWVSHRLTGWGLLFLWLLPFTQNVAQQINSSPCSCLVRGSICFQILLDVFLIQHPSCGTPDLPIFFIFSFFGRGVTNVRLSEAWRDFGTSLHWTLLCTNHTRALSLNNQVNTKENLKESCQPLQLNNKTQWSHFTEAYLSL